MDSRSCECYGSDGNSINSAIEKASSICMYVFPRHMGRTLMDRFLRLLRIIRQSLTGFFVIFYLPRYLRYTSTPPAITGPFFYLLPFFSLLPTTFFSIYTSMIPTCFHVPLLEVPACMYGRIHTYSINRYVEGRQTRPMTTPFYGMACAIPSIIILSMRRYLLFLAPSQ